MTLARQGAKENAYVKKDLQVLSGNTPPPSAIHSYIPTRIFFLDAALDPPCASRDRGTVGN